MKFKNINIIAGYLLIALFFSCKEDMSRTYFDQNWNQIDQVEQAAYFREQSRTENGNWLIKDYYITGEKQFVGQTKDSLATIYDGDVTWYTKKGKVLNKIRYSKGMPIGTYAVANGASGTEETGWNEEDLYFIDSSRVEDATSEVVPYSREFEWNYINPPTIAIQKRYNTGYKDKTTSVLYFSKQGDTIGRLTHNQKGEPWQGKEVLFYEDTTRDRDNKIGVQYVKTYEQGKVTNIIHFAENEQLIATLRLDSNEQPFEGTLYESICENYKILRYGNGNLIEEITYNFSDEIIGRATFENNKPVMGQVYNCEGYKTYRNGMLNGPIVTYHYSGGEKGAVAVFHYKNGLKDGDYVINETSDKVLEKGTYKKNKLVNKVYYYCNKTEVANFDEIEDTRYYIKATLNSRKKTPYITEITKFNIDDEVLKNFVFKKNTFQTSTFLDSGYHSISEEDINSDGHPDLQLYLQSYQYDMLSIMHFVYNPLKHTYNYLPVLDNTFLDNLIINTQDRTITQVLSDEYEEGGTEITYAFLNDDLVRTKEIEKLYYDHRDTLITTQVFPIDVKAYPLLASELPPLQIEQNNITYDIINTNQKISLQSEPFTISFPGLKSDEFGNGFNAKIVAGPSHDIFKQAYIGEKEDSFKILSNESSYAVSLDFPLSLNGDGNNVLFYNGTDFQTISDVKELNEETLLFQYTVDIVYYNQEETTISEVVKPLYMMVYMDKNLNFKIEKNELFYVTITFQ